VWKREDSEQRSYKELNKKQARKEGAVKLQWDQKGVRGRGKGGGGGATERQKQTKEARAKESE
jgi:hypothetical protein